MNPEIPNFEQPKNTEVDLEKQELTPEQKRALGEAWTEMVVDNTSIPKNISKMEQDEIKKWLFGSIMKNIEMLAKELGLQVDAELVEKIQKAESLDEKSTLELEYIKNVHAQVDDIVQKFDKSADKSTRWDSWPKKMRETKEFNCVGASLIGVQLLQRGGIKSFYGNPSGHVLNIVQLANGEWWYVDFLNGQQNIKKIEPEITTLVGVTVLKINDQNIDHSLIPIYDNAEAVASVLNNLSLLEQEANDATIPDEDAVKKEARSYLKKHEELYKKTNFSLFFETLYPKFIEVDKTEEMQQEMTRVDSMRDFEKPVRNYIETLTKEQEKALFEEMKSQKKAIENLFYQEDMSVLQKTSPELKKVLELFLENLKGVKEKQPEVYREAIDKIVGRIRNL